MNLSLSPLCQVLYSWVKDFAESRNDEAEPEPDPSSRRYATVGVFVAETAGGVRVAVTGAGPAVFRWAEAEAALAGNFSPAALDNLTVDPDGLNSDIHASNEYRASLVKVMAKRAVAACG